MDSQFNTYFIDRWRKYFADAELPICYFYSNQIGDYELSHTKNEHRCMICNLNRVREGFPYVYNAKSPGCSGGKRYSGFSKKLRPNFEYFLSCGIPGKLEGERYKKTPQLVEELLKINPVIEAPAKYLIFKRWDKLAQEEQPSVVIFFATPDVLSGLFTLANYDRADAHGVISPMGAGCASIINFAYVESKLENPRCILGMFDVSARPCVPANTLTFTVPLRRFEVMVGNMDESFLITESWKKVRDRL
jgi:hypothetical protein